MREILHMVESAIRAMPHHQAMSAAKPCTTDASPTTSNQQPTVLCKEFPARALPACLSALLGGKICCRCHRMLARTNSIRAALDRATSIPHRTTALPAPHVTDRMQQHQGDMIQSTLAHQTASPLSLPLRIRVPSYNQLRTVAHPAFQQRAVQRARLLAASTT